MDTLKEQKKTYLKLLFPAKGQTKPALRFQGFEDDWKEVKLGEVGNTYTGLSGKTKDDFGHGEGRFVTYLNVFSNPISSPELVEAVEIDNRQNTVLYGDVLFTTSSETPEEVGMSSVWLENVENMYLNSFCFGFRPVKKVNSYYLAYLFRSQGMRKKISFLAQGISRYNISKIKMMELEISIPNEKEQEVIGTFFQTLDQEIAQV
ncbi:TPA: restriction endonuclease subunit S [Streptococcus suis]|nr:restriction endonuclease subunit S [Streptococcus suis]